MKKDYTKVALGFSAVAGTLFILPTASFAQAQQAQLSGIEEIVVTSRRREENLQAVPLSVAAFSDTQLEQRSVRRFEDIAQFVPNLIMGEGDRADHTRVAIRGIGGGNPDPARSFGTGLYVDGIYIANSVGAFDSAFDIERIEVLRGPQGTLFGRNTTGGLINVVTKKPGPDPESTLQLDYGRFDYVRVKYSNNSVLIDDKLFARVGVNFESDGGYYKELSTGQGWSDIENRTGKLALRYLPNDNWTLDVTGSYSWQPRHANGGTCEYVGMTKNQGLANKGAPFGDTVEAACNASSPASTGSEYKFYEDQPGISHTQTRYVAFQPQWDSNGPVGFFENLTASFNLAYRYTENEYMQPTGDFTRLNFSNRGTDVYRASGGRTNTSYTAEALFNGTAMDSKLDLTAGAYYFVEKAGARGTNCFDLAQSVVGTGQLAVCSNPGTNTILLQLASNPGQVMSAGAVYTDNWTWAGFTHATYNVTEAFKVDVGLRYTVDHKASQVIDWQVREFSEGYLHVVGDGAIDNMVDSAQTWYRWTPKIGVSYEIADVGALDSANIYATYSTGFTAGGTNNEGGATIESTFPTYDPETVTSYEVGTKTTWNGNTMRFNVAGFLMDYKDKQEEITLNNEDLIFGAEANVSFIGNVAAVRIKGVEIESYWNPIDNLLLDASFAYLSYRYRGALTSNIPANLLPYVEGIEFDGDAVANIGNNSPPPWTATFGASYTFDLGDGSSITPRANYTHHDDVRETSATNIHFRKVNPLTGAAGYCYEPGLKRLDGRITWENADRNVSLAAYGTNLTNQKQIRACVAGRAATSMTPSGFGVATKILEAPIKWGVTATLRY